MSLNLKRSRNNPNPIRFKKEPKQQKQSEDEIEIIEVTTNGNHNNYQIPFKREKTDDNYNAFDCSILSNNKRIIQLELENKSLKSKINDLKFRLNKYEPKSNDEIMSSCESDTDFYSTTFESESDLDQTDDQNSNKVINIFEFLLKYNSKTYNSRSKPNQIDSN